MMHPSRVRFIDSNAATVAELTLSALPRVGEHIRFRAGAGGLTTLTVKTVTYTLPDPTDPPADKEQYDAEVVLELTPIAPVQEPAEAPKAV